IHQRGGVPDLFHSRPSARLETGVTELVAEYLERHAVLQGQRDRRGEAVHQAGDRRTFFRRGDEDLARSPVLVQPNCQIALISPNIEMMDNSLSLVRQAPPNRLHCYRVLDISHRNTYKRNFGGPVWAPTGPRPDGPAVDHPLRQQAFSLLTAQARTLPE